jgi:beta-glucosidase/6-phospho-beta-glucosidase/beta-galactosidase
VKAAHIADLMFNRSFLDPVLRGHYPALFMQTAETIFTNL